MFKNIFGKLFPTHFPRRANRLISTLVYERGTYSDFAPVLRDAMDITRQSANKGHTPCPHCPPRWQVNA